MVLYFAVSPDVSAKRIAANRQPKYYEAGQDVTGAEDALASYRQFIGRISKEYDALALIFEFLTIDAEQPMYEQHRRIREAFASGRRRPWAKWNIEALTEWIDAFGEPSHAG
jgi:thymidylate kinase